MQTKIAVLSQPPELEIEDSFFNKACIYEPNLKIASFAQIDVKGVKAGNIYPAEIEFNSTAKGLSIKVISVDVEHPKAFDIVERK